MSQAITLPPGVKGYECRHVFCIPSSFNRQDDACFVKEIIHMDDGSTKPNLRRIKNFQRDFYYTREGYRNHSDKKESELLSRLVKKSCNQRNLGYEISRALNLYSPNPSVRRLARSQYLYGADISSAALLKRKYMTSFPGLQSACRVAVLDIETDVIKGTGDIITVSITSKNRAILAITEDFFEQSEANLRDIHKAFEKYLSKHKKERNIDLEVVWAKNGGEAVVKVMEWAHALKPDWMAVWNVDFDLPIMIEQLEKFGYNPAEVFSDPSVPREYMYSEYIQGPPQKVSSSGKVMPLSYHERWHTFIAPSTFYWIDAMCVYSFIRKAKGNLPSYSLNYVLEEELGERKLNFDVADGYTEIEWHQFMQQHYKLEYLIYNVFDCIGVELLDEKTKDLSITLPELCGFSEYKDFKSTPKQLADDLHFFYLEQKGRVIATTSDQMRDDLDDMVISMDEWIITLPCHLVDENGLKCIKDLPELKTCIRAWVSDLDVKSAYPYTEILANISKETTLLELSDIEGVTEAQRRVIGLNLTGGRVNCVELCTAAFGLPQLDVLLTDYENQKK